MRTLYLIVPLAPLLGAIVAGLFGRQIGRAGAHWVTIGGMVVSTVAAALVFQDVLAGNTFNGAVYTWATSGGHAFEIGFLIDRLSALMMLVVAFVSLTVHIYTIGYMADDPGYQRFFSYISLFTFSMLMLVMSNNFLQLFFGWEAVGLVSYLLIGFWYTRPSANYASLKAFLANRVGDLGFLLGIALVLVHFGTLDYAQVFTAAPGKTAGLVWSAHGVQWPLITTVCVCLFIGAMGKSAQFPLHVWLPDSMEGPTPISALIHAATMVTAGIFMVARMSPLFELSETALSLVIVIGAITALFMGLLGIVQNDIKRVVAYSTLSQLGYMTVALGASAYSTAIFHLVTHAFFKALLFLAAGSVIIALHHEQDMRRMGGLRRRMPITWITSLIGSLALIGFPFFSGFYSKESIIEAVHLSKIPGAGLAYAALTIGVFVTALYSFRMYFLVFEGRERFAAEGAHAGHGDHHSPQPPRESPAVVWVPLVALAVPSVMIGAAAIGPLLFAGFFGESIHVAPGHETVGAAAPFPGWAAMALHGFATLPFWLAAAGVLTAWFLYVRRPEVPARIQAAVRPLYVLLDQKYYFDRFNDWFFAGGARLAGRGLWRFGDVAVIDGVLVNGSARLVAWFAGVVRRIQSGFIYHYAFTMIIGVFVLLTLWFARA
jgi:NADH-quinone oxidoreductase subunit L